MTRLGLLLALSTTVAYADDKKLGASEFAAGRAAYASGDYLGAALKFEAAFRYDPDPAYIFNVGQAYRRRAETKSKDMDRDCAHSAHAYRLFLEMVKEPPNRREVDTYVDEMVRCAGKTLAKIEPFRLPVVEPDKQVDNVVEPDKQVDKVVEPDRGVETQTTGPIGGRVDTTKSKLTTVGLVAGGVGAVGLGVAGYFAYRGSAIANEQDDLNPEVENGALEYKKLDRDGKAANRNAFIFGAVGVAGVATGVVLYVLGRKHDREQRVTVVPARGGAAINVRF